MHCPSCRVFPRIGSFEFILISLNLSRHKIIKASKTSMMTTRGPSGFLTSRAMAPASCSFSSPSYSFRLCESYPRLWPLGLQMNPYTSITSRTIRPENSYVFHAHLSTQRATYHFHYIQEELDYDPHVNVSFYDPSTTNWISVSGTAKLSTDRNLIKQYWNTGVKAWFGDLGDGVRKGDENDPRISVIEVVPEQVSDLHAFYLISLPIIPFAVGVVCRSRFGQ